MLLTPRLLMPLLLLCAVAASAQASAPAAPAAVAVVVDLEGPIGPAVKDHVVRAIAAAAERRAAVVVLRMDTPGGLDESTRDIVKAILASSVPVVTFVSPSGARAASAGAYILYASHVAAMAPATNVGAATPVAVGGASPERPPREEPAGAAPRDAVPRDARPGPVGDAPSGRSSASGEPRNAAERKAVNDSAAYLRGLAELRGRNADWAEQAVRAAASLPAEEALAQGVIDVVAPDLPALLERIDGRQVVTASGTVALATAGVVVERIETDWRTRLLAIVTNPTIAYGLLLIGIYGLLLEGYNPGALVPGIIGAIALVLALFSFQVLPVNYAGLALILLGVLMLLGEVLMAGTGVLAIGGLVAFVFGSVILIDTDVPGFGVSRTLIASIAVTAGALMLGTMWLAARGQRRPVTTGVEQLLHDDAVVVEPFTGRGRVRVHGETWFAVADVPLAAGQRVRIVRVDGLTLHVVPTGSAQESPDA